MRDNLVEKIQLYLPYNLMVMGGDDFWTVYSYSCEGTFILKNWLAVQAIQHSSIGVDYYPILKDLSAFDDNEQKRCEIECMGSTNGEPYPMVTIMARKVDWMLRNHYDLFGLIKNGLAINLISIYEE